MTLITTIDRNKLISDYDNIQFMLVLLEGKKNTVIKQCHILNISHQLFNTNVIMKNSYGTKGSWGSM